MERAIRIVKLVLPATVGVAAALVKASAGQLGVPLSLSLLGGALLGWTVALLLEGTAVLLGARPQGRSPGQRRLRQLERDELLVQRAIKELEFNAKVQRLGDAEAAALAEPLRRQAKRLLRQIDDERAELPRGVEGQIEAELARRRAEPTRREDRP
jgi:hypothetical protein